VEFLPIPEDFLRHHHSRSEYAQLIVGSSRLFQIMNVAPQQIAPNQRRLPKEKIGGMTIAQLRQAAKTNGMITIVIGPTGDLIVAGDPRGPNNPPENLVATFGLKVAKGLVNPKDLETKREAGKTKVPILEQAEKQAAHLRPFLGDELKEFVVPDVVKERVNALLAIPLTDWKKNQLVECSEIFKILKTAFLAMGKTKQEWLRFFH
jgi:hypothetical protein